MKIRSGSQNKSIHKGCDQIADVLIENGVSLQAFLEHLEIRPTKEAIFEIFRSMSLAKYEVTTSKLETKQVDPIWDELIEALGKTTQVYIPFPSTENTDEYLESFNQQ